MICQYDSAIPNKSRRNLLFDLGLRERQLQWIPWIGRCFNTSSAGSETGALAAVDISYIVDNLMYLLSYKPRSIPEFSVKNPYTPKSGTSPEDYLQIAGCRSDESVLSRACRQQD